MSREERDTLAAIETALRADDPELARMLTTFTRPRLSRQLRTVLAAVLTLVPLILVLHSRTAAILIGALVGTVPVLCSKPAFSQACLHGHDTQRPARRSRGRTRQGATGEPAR